MIRFLHDISKTENNRYGHNLHLFLRICCKGWMNFNRLRCISLTFQSTSNMLCTCVKRRCYVASVISRLSALNRSHALLKPADAVNYVVSATITDRMQIMSFLEKFRWLDKKKREGGGGCLLLILLIKYFGDLEAPGFWIYSWAWNLVCVEFQRSFGFLPPTSQKNLLEHELQLYLPLGHEHNECVNCIPVSHPGSVPIYIYIYKLSWSQSRRDDTRSRRSNIPDSFLLSGENCTNHFFF